MGISPGNVMKKEFKLTQNLYQQMIEHAKQCYPQEACGFLVGREGLADCFIPLENMEHSSVSYAMDPKEQLRIFKKLSEDWEGI